MATKIVAGNKSAWTLINKKPAFFIEKHGLICMLLDVLKHLIGAESRNRTGTPCGAGF